MYYAHACVCVCGPEAQSNMIHTLELACGRLVLSHLTKWERTHAHKYTHTHTASEWQRFLAEIGNRSTKCLSASIHLNECLCVYVYQHRHTQSGEVGHLCMFAFLCLMLYRHHDVKCQSDCDRKRKEAFETTVIYRVLKTRTLAYERQLYFIALCFTVRKSQKKSQV